MVVKSLATSLSDQIMRLDTLAMSSAFAPLVNTALYLFLYSSLPLSTMLLRISSSPSMDS